MTPWIELPVLHHWPMTTGQPPAAHNPLYFFILQAKAIAWGLIYPYTVQVVERSHYTAKLSPLTVCTLMQQQKLMLLFLGSKKPGSVNFENWSCSSHYFLLYLLLHLWYYYIADIQTDVLQDYCCGITDLFDWWWGRLGHSYGSKVLNTKVVMVELLCKVVTIIAEGERGRKFCCKNCTAHILYSGKHSQEKAFVNWWKVRFSWRTFTDCLLVLPKDGMPPNFAEKLSQIATKSRNLQKVFSIKSFHAVQYMLYLFAWVLQYKYHYCCMEQRWSYMKSRLPIMLTVFPIMKSFGENHSFTSLSDTSITQEGKLASKRGGGGREGGRRGRKGGRDEAEKMINTSSKTWGS